MNNEEMMEEKVVEISQEQMEKVTGGRGRDDGREGSPNKLNGPFCSSCGRELMFANGSYKCTYRGCPLKGEPQEGTYN
jgi:hypothetical protein